MEFHAMKTLLLTFAFGLSLYVSADLHAPVVHTKLGSLKGEYVSVKGKDSGIHAFLGVPFAKPPVGPALRLAAPQPVEAWEGMREATQQPHMCIQSKKVNIDLLKKFGLEAEIPDISEDCLYLNIYTPANRAPEAKLPVMVWIHGGGFTMGSASMYDGSALGAYQNVVVVAIQYRLGLLGFLSTGDDSISGNFGLLDQVEALKWVQQHIHNFGGNPDLVTIFGESAGGISVCLQLLSPLSKGLFHHAIAESGTAAMDMLVYNDPVPNAKVVANMSGCNFESTERFGHCMRNLDMDTVVTISEDINVRYSINVDGHFLKKPVGELFRNHELITVPFMTGINSDEGGYLLADLVKGPQFKCNNSSDNTPKIGPETKELIIKHLKFRWLISSQVINMLGTRDKTFVQDWKEWDTGKIVLNEGIDRETLKNILSIFFPGADFLDLILDEYIGNGEDRVKNRKGYTDILGDIIFNIPAVKTANIHRDAGATVYLYEYRQPPSFLKAIRPSFVESDHGDEIFSVFGYCFTTAYARISGNCLEEDEQMNKIMMAYWGNFAHTGSPNGDGLVEWPKYGAEEEYLEIDAKQMVRQHLKKDQFVFMTQTLPKKIQEQEKTGHSEL